MYLLLTDETNKEPSVDAKFFMYGGILFPLERLVILNAGIASIRESVGYSPGDEFKFDSNSRPDGISTKEFTEAKNAVIDLCLENDVKFIVHVILHKIIARQDPSEQVMMAADYVIGRFNYFLRLKSDTGICIVDNLPTKIQFRYLSDKFQSGLSFPGAKGPVSLDNIQLFGATCINASHVNSAMDIILGAFRYSINNPQNADAASTMMKKVVSMMWNHEAYGKILYNGYGFIPRPPLNKIGEKAYKKEYEQLIKHIESLVNP